MNGRCSATSSTGCSSGASTGPRPASVSHRVIAARTPSQTGLPAARSGSSVPRSSSAAQSAPCAAAAAVRSRTWSPTATPTRGAALVGGGEDPERQCLQAERVVLGDADPPGGPRPQGSSRCAPRRGPRPRVAPVVDRRPASPSSSGRKVSTMTASSSKDSAPRLRSTAPGCGPWVCPPGCRRIEPCADAGALARLVVAADVEHDLVGVDVRVVVGHRHRQRVVVDLARHEVADDEAVSLEHLVHRRRLVHPPGDRLEVGDVERVRVQAAVPADDVERVLAARRGRCRPARPARAAVLDEDLDVVALDDQRRGGPAQVALAVRRVLEELAVA